MRSRSVLSWTLALGVGACFLGCAGGPADARPGAEDAGEPTGASCSCGAHGTCTPTGGCVCDRWFDWDGETCAPVSCTADEQCSDDDPCSGEEHCQQGRCAPGERIACTDGSGCSEHPLRLPGVERLPTGARLAVLRRAETPVEVGIVEGRDARAPADWSMSDAVAIPGTPGPVTVFARSVDPGCPFETSRSYDVVEPEGDDVPGLALDDSAIVAWATDFDAEVAYGDEVTDDFRHPDLALGPATGGTLDTVSLGRGGSIVLRFARPLADEAGADFAVFENALPGFHEYAFVEVSSDGVEFVRFDSVFGGTEPICQYALRGPTVVEGLAGAHARGAGTPFDLALLDQHPAVLAGGVDLARIVAVRLVDVVGCLPEQTACDTRGVACPEATLDSLGTPILDPFPTRESAGFDLEAIAVLHQSAR